VYSEIFTKKYDWLNHDTIQKTTLYKNISHLHKPFFHLKKRDLFKK
jgi:hypothetical protein